MVNRIISFTMIFFSNASFIAFETVALQATEWTEQNENTVTSYLKNDKAKFFIFHFIRNRISTTAEKPASFMYVFWQ
ncbi:hypothetical protein H650_00965 [Enterobacter sp. R4-368]|nr:hypothetical protein H650_00965 [Enterobacter sp. R4-368]